jgi:hypothetical protein
MLEPDRMAAQGAASGAFELDRGSEVDDRGQAQRRQQGHVRVAQLVQGVTAEQPPPSGGPAAPARVATEVTEVERTREGDQASRLLVRLVSPF